MLHRNSAVRVQTSAFWPIIRETPRYFLLVTLAALTLRLIFYFKFPHIAGDSLIYGDIAKNWVNHGVFGLTHAEGVRPTWIRLPGYPAFLAGCFVFFGQEHYHAVLLAQIVIDVVSCFFIADLARRTVSVRASRFAFLLAALCPFTANYTVAPLAETLSIFFVAVALDAAAAGFKGLDEGQRAWPAWIWCGVAISCGILLRPDGGILLIAIGVYLLWRMWRLPAQRTSLFLVGMLLVAVAAAPLVPWTIRNWWDFHRFQPLVPESASDPDEFVPDGFNRWVKTWSADYVSNEELYWRVPDNKLDLGILPSRAFDSSGQRAQTQSIADEYNKKMVVDPALDGRFLQLAGERISSHPLRYYVWLPAMRIADMWLRPRTEMLPLNSRWWEFGDDSGSSIVAAVWGALNLLFLIAATLGAVRGPRPRHLGLMLLFVLLRSAFLGTLANPEPRYTLECYPVVLLLAGAWISSWKSRDERAVARAAGTT